MLSSTGVQSQLRTVTKAHHDAKIRYRRKTTKFSKKETQRPDNTWTIALKEKPNQYKKRKAQSAQEVQPRKTMQRIHLSPVDHDFLSHLLP